MLFCPCQTKAIPSCCQALYYSSCTLYNLLSLFLHNLSSGICSRTVSPSFPDIVPLVHLPPPPYSFSYILTLLCHSFPVYSNSCMALLKLNSTKPGRFVGKGIKDVHILRHGTVTDSVFVLLCYLYNRLFYVKPISDCSLGFRMELQTLVLSILGKFKLPKFYMWNEIKICIM